MPISTHNAQFGGKPGSAQETLNALIKRYGKKKGTSIFYGMVMKRGGKVNRSGRRRSPLHKALGK